MSIETGGPAFPLQSIGPDFSHGYAGMTMRDYFAAKALQAFISLGGGGHNLENVIEEKSKLSFRYADAMIKERNKP